MPDSCLLYPRYAKYNGVLRFFIGPPEYSKTEVQAATADARKCPPHLQEVCETELRLGKWTWADDGSVVWTWRNKCAPYHKAVRSFPLCAMDALRGTGIRRPFMQ